MFPQSVLKMNCSQILAKQSYHDVLKVAAQLALENIDQRLVVKLQVFSFHVPQVKLLIL